MLWIGIVDQSSLVGVLYRSLHRDQQGKKGSLFPEAKSIQKGGVFSVKKIKFWKGLRRVKLQKVTWKILVVKPESLKDLSKF
jgi:hypothetical protein